MPLEIETIRVLEGPNIYLPQSGLALRLRSDKDRSRRLRDAIKDAAQAAGLVIGFIECHAEALDEGFVVTCVFATPQPDAAQDLAAYVVEGLNRRLAHDDEWDEEGPLLALRGRIRREAPALGLVQLIAEARQRGLPVLRAPDGRTWLGYGVRGWSFDGAGLAFGEQVVPPWHQIGVVPVVVTSGGDAEACASLVAQALAEGGTHVVRLVQTASFDAARAVLCDPAAETVVLGLDASDALLRGVLFDRCAASVITAPAGLPIASSARIEMLRALGLPLLLTRPPGRAVLCADDAEVLSLATYAVCPLIFYSAYGESPALVEHRARGGATLCPHDNDLVAAQGNEIVAVLPIGGGIGPASVAAAALLWALDTPWERIRLVIKASAS